MEIVLILSIVGLCLVIVVGASLVYDGVRYRLPYAPSSRGSIERMLSYADSIESKTVLDVGSGTGDVLIAVAKKGGTAIGIEINLFLAWFTRVRAHLCGVGDKVRVIRGNMFTSPLPHADIVVLYILPNAMKQLAPVLLAQLPPHALVISHSFPLAGWTAYKDTEEVKVYRVFDQAR